MDESRGYDLIAPYYDVLSRIVFGRSLSKAQINYLNEIPTGSKVLVLGGGTGRWLRETSIRRANPIISYIDLSPAMIKKARRNGDGLNIEFFEGTQEVLRGGEDFDVVIMFCFLDLFDDRSLPHTIGGIMRSMKPGARWLIVDFVNHKWWHGTLLSVMYKFFRVMTGLKNRKLPSWQLILGQKGIQENKCELFYGDFIKSGSWTNVP